ncbi:MAG: tetratricopeptide repeat protein, partial [Thermodesulfovibrionales bacterium]
PPPLLRGNRSTTFRQVFDKHYILSLAFFILALLSKPMAVSLPAVLLILDWYPFKRITSLKTLSTSFIEKFPFIALSIASSIVTILAQKAGGSVAPMTALPFSTRMLVAAQSLIMYLWKMILPLNLIPLYPYPRDISFFSLEFLAPMFLVVVITAACIVMLRKAKLWFTVWLYYAVTLLPVIGIVQVGSQSMADRYTYLPSFGPFLIAGLIAAGIYEKAGTFKKGGALPKAGSIVTASVILVVMSYAAVRQIGIWRDGITLWDHVIEKEPLKVPLAYNNGGFALMDKGRIDEAIEYFQTAIRLDPADEKAFNNLGLAYKAKGLYDKAIDQFRAALTLSPDDAEVHNNLGVVFKYKGMSVEAIEEHRIALRLRPAYAEAHFNLGVIYLDSGALDKAREEFEAGLKIKPDDQKARQMLNEMRSG